MAEVKPIGVVRAKIVQVQQHGFTYAEAARVVDTNGRRQAALPIINEILAQKGKLPAKNASSKIRQMKKFLRDGCLAGNADAIAAAEQYPETIVLVKS